MKIRPLVLALALLVPAMPLLRAEEKVSLPAKKDLHLFLLAGQSNMAGRGKVDDEGRTPNPRILSLNKAGAWQPAVDPLHWDKGSAGAGIGKPFAEILAAKDPGVSIGLIPAACGGSPIAAWVPGAAFKATNSHPYDDAISRAKRAMQDGTLKGILWHQGESNSSGKSAGNYAQLLEEMITRFRTDLDAPELPFIIGQLGRFPAKPWGPGQEGVDAAHQAVAKKMKNVRFVSAEGLESRADNLHFSTAALRTFAKGYADAYLNIVGASNR